ncbi:hypothetical protein HYH03_002561 [Edaphochlamys debaryana]|uniref:EGF-like domain-containing protein n=1 Tax=Edaphochlamys debaryana TaxID=47281 RepID=A0A835YB14_9CHLO|nr:hypothetical protein HYH03_002561 [Edaphochlamys debaryana]|eukprot:KAG2499622.1 hypothetical protein HYH03_002561 [Edaphochlamys debaryana]
MPNKLVLLLGLLLGARAGAADVSPAWAAKELKKDCSPGCTENIGNCNAEFGRCECRFGFGGDDCSKLLLPACMTAKKLTAVPLYGLGSPRNCYCYRQLEKLSCSHEYTEDPLYCDHVPFWAWEDLPCYEYDGVPEEEQISDFPDESAPGAKKLKWYVGCRKHGQNPTFQFEASRRATADGFHWANRGWSPVDKCRERCNDRGQCNGGHCRCAPFYMGETCETETTVHCPLGCSGRGTCHPGGFCHCKPGFWGEGCARSKAYTAEVATPHPTRLRIYVYELPQTVSYMRPTGEDHWPLHDPIYLAETEFHHRLLGDWAVRTENPWEANLFFVPTHLYYYTSNIGFPGHHYTKVFDYVRRNHPWWNMTAGRNHFVVASNDRGCCDLYRLSPEVQHPIKVVHFAQEPRHGVALLRGEAAKGGGGLLGLGPGAGEDPKKIMERLGINTDDPAMIGAAIELKHLDGRPRFKGFPVYQLPALQQEREQCFRHEHDVAFPPHLTALEERWSEAMPEQVFTFNRDKWLQVLTRAYDLDANGSAVFRRDVQRDLLLYFNGYTKEDMAYSAGVRQGLLSMFADNPRSDLSINKGGGTDSMLRSRFCFTPMGLGWGIRLSQAVYTGCVPILVHDHVWPYLWDVLPYEEFSVRISRHNLHRLLDLLEAITPDQLATLQDGLARHYRAFVWQVEGHGLAYNYTLASLHKKLLNMWTAVFRRQH